ncbi:hypothetical protein FJR48_01685 [Sulfurimonas lithotrophica]|uniref:Uncharacterized protein n=1 Tax=Sulfurimonas lithotrophica TaxID=2590022 RepID=A0A5P8NYJ1_9BACT|nr:hypothetical protein FJR48_01685 [Sulfurimonas lithotrophica]
MVLDIVIILAMCFPMLLFTVYPGLKLGDYLEQKHAISEASKRKVVIIFTVVFTVTLSSLLYYI